MSEMSKTNLKSKLYVWFELYKQFIKSYESGSLEEYKHMLKEFKEWQQAYNQIRRLIEEAKNV